ncbi:hydrogenase [Parasporobacterium paucivorans]|uniref:Hydrogenase-4 component E n=1 Tax=Parasporobacterium paucivorans DSM 15970 TaxID=1122934 RepID=A0A1M6FCV7_9FIRM|nr:hydrogenase [Parasporobacterium paucivorans]SHI95507.1 hydrogenase-4 component E [Parasporobacterium paucivorans DSM 15970]
MLEILTAVILITAIIMAGFRRINLLTKGFRIQSLAIGLLCFALGYLSGESHYYVIGVLTLITKTVLIPHFMNRSIKELSANREMDPIINGWWSSVIAGIFIAVIYVVMEGFNSDFIIAGVVLLVTGALMLVARKKAITQMTGFLVMENGLVLLELSMIKMGLLIDILIILEVLLISAIMAIMIFYINKVFHSVNTDYLSNLKD